MLEHRKNTLPGDCSVCGVELGAGKGVVVRDPVRVLCVEHLVLSAPDDATLGDRLRATYGLHSWAVSPYQIAGAAFLSGRWAALLSDDKGLGKTAQAALAIPQDAPVVIVCPAQVKGVWSAELGVWRPGMEAVALAGRSSWLAPGPGTAVILNYAILPPVGVGCENCGHLGQAHRQQDGCADCDCERYRGRLPTRGEVREALGLRPGTVLIIDEAHKAKSLKATRTRRLRYLARGCERVWGLTASPIMNHPRELWAIYRVLGLERAAFPLGRQEFNAMTSFYDDQARPTRKVVEAFQARRNKVELGRSADDVGLQLPELRFEDRLVKLDAAAAVEIEAALVSAVAGSKARKEVRRGKITAAEVPARIKELEAYGYSDEDVRELVAEVIERREWADVREELARLRRVLALAKIDAARTYARECMDAGEALVVFSAHVAPVTALGGLDDWVTLRDQARRTELIARFQAGEFKGVAGTIRASSEGITLTRARLCLFVDRDWTPEANDQALKRIHRRGQSRPCLITTLVVDHPIDRYVAETLRRKQVMIQQLTARSVTR